MKKIGFIFGTRPEVIKCIPLIIEAKNKGLETLVVFTGQHKEMALPLFDLFGIKADIELEIMSGSQGLALMSAKLLCDLQEHEASLKECDVVMVQGDTTSAFVGGYFCFLNQIKIAHIEAGLRTNNLSSPFPEEGNRQLLSRICNYHFTPTLSASNDLKLEGVSLEAIHNVGNTGIDMLEIMKEQISERQYADILERNNISTKKEFVLITGHRRENFGAGLESICSTLNELAVRYPDLNFIYPVHLNPNVKNIVEGRLSGYENIHLIAPLDYISFVSLMAKARIIMTDSGGIQEEAPSFKKPLIVMRETTERPEGVKLGIARLCGTDKDKIIKYDV